MTAKKNLPDLSKKLKIYKRKGLPNSRVVFESGIPAYMQTSKHKPYGWLPLYDDMTEKDLVSLFRQYKKARKKRLRESGIDNRRYITAREKRDSRWVKMASKYDSKPDYKKLAEEWANKNQKQLVVMIFDSRWRKPAGCVSPILQDLIINAQKKGLQKESLLEQKSNAIEKEIVVREYVDFVGFNLPRIIRSAVKRYPTLM